MGDLKSAAAAMGRKGGAKKVPKGLAKVDPSVRLAAQEQGRAVRWRNYYAGENQLNGTPIPAHYVDTIAAMTKEEHMQALEAAEKRAGSTTKRPKASGKSE